MKFSSGSARGSRVHECGQQIGAAVMYDPGEYILVIKRVVSERTAASDNVHEVGERELVTFRGSLSSSF